MKEIGWELFCVGMYMLIFDTHHTHATVYSGNNQGLDSFPIDIPEDTTVISLDYNNIQTLPIVADIVPYVEKIYLYDNQITHIRRAQFSRLTYLWFLVLTNNPLVMIELPTEVPALTNLYVPDIPQVLEASQLVADIGTLTFRGNVSEGLEAWCWILVIEDPTGRKYRSCNADERQDYLFIYLKGKMNIMVMHKMSPTGYPVKCATNTRL